MNQTTPTPRYEFLDWLRVLAIFLLLFFHTGMLFVGWGWHITNAETIPALQLPMDLAHRLRMPLLFVIAGAGMWFALKRRTGKAFIAERTGRLLVPAIIGMLLIVPPQVFLERVADGQWSGGYLDFIWQRVFQFEPYPAGDFSWHHLWFIIYLYVYVLLLVPLLLWWRRARPELRPGVWMYALALPLGINEALLKPLFPESHNLIHDWYIFIHYLLLTIYGFVLASMPGAWDWFAKHRRWSLALGLTVLLRRSRAHRSRRDPSRYRRGLGVRQHFHVGLAAGVSRLRPPAPELRQSPAHVGARCQLSGLHPAPDRDHHDRVQGDPAAVGRRGRSTGSCWAQRCSPVCCSMNSSCDASW